jgi:hypothetical protein
MNRKSYKALALGSVIVGAGYGVTVLIFTILLTVYSPNSRIDVDKQREFEALFIIGSSKEEVWRTLSGLDGISYARQNLLPYGDVAFVYNIPFELSGAPSYAFRFSPDDVLIAVYPVYP